MTANKTDSKTLRELAIVERWLNPAELLELIFKQGFDPFGIDGASLHYSSFEAMQNLKLISDDETPF